MGRKEVIVQISTGGYRECRVTAGEVRERLDFLFPLMNVGKVIIGWSCDTALYEAVTDFLRKNRVESYLWLPVFSETGVLKENLGRTLDWRGETARSFELSAGENFEFYCPNQKKNRDAFLEIYQEQFGKLHFDGVFLDKIRYASCANGLGGIFGCFCPDCMKLYEEQGVDTRVLREEMEKVSRGQGGYGESALGIRAYKNGAYTFENPVWEDFFAAKALAVERALEEIVSGFKKMGLKVGMDTFAPYLAGFSGQNIRNLSSIADFIKPMMYRITHAPAGLPFETKRFLEETVRGDQKAAERKLFQALGCGNGKAPWSDMDFLRRELAYASGGQAPVYCGFEINRNQAADSTPEYIEETVKELNGLSQTPAGGYVLSWDLMTATEENLKAAAACLGEDMDENPGRG